MLDFLPVLRFLGESFRLIDQLSVEGFFEELGGLPDAGDCESNVVHHVDW